MALLEMLPIVPMARTDTIIYKHLLADFYVVLRWLGGSGDKFTFATTFMELSPKTGLKSIQIAWPMFVLSPDLKLKKWLSKP